MTNKKLIGARDPLGIRPLVLGKLDGCPILASETCALDIIGAKYVRDVENGEVVVFDEDGAHSHKPFPPMAPRPCIFEYIYFARPDFDRRRPRRSTTCARRMGAQLAREAPAARRRHRAGAGLRRAGRDGLSRRRPASPTRWASSATTTSAAPSSSRPSTSASSACA